MRCVISVLGKDRSGIVAAISGVLAEKGANIADINEVQEALTKAGEDLGVQVIIQREEVFQAMYTI